MKPCFHEQGSSESSLEWDTLPVLGGDPARQRCRARVWRVIFALLLIFWASIAWLFLGAG